MEISVKAYAKINLMLDILDTLPNGYHDLFMIMQSVGVYDIIKIEENDTGNITVSCTNADIPINEDNIAYTAAKVFFDHTALPFKGLNISIEKHIPHAAGLAGGSADAAGVIIGLNKLYSANLTDREIIEIGSKVGSDVPFCAIGGLMLAQYTGTILSYLPAQAFGKLVIVKPDCDVSTGLAYKAFDTAERVRHLDRNGMFQSVMNNDIEGIYSRINNVFEQFIDVPERVEIKAVMRKNNVKATCMSGSGPSVFGIFESEEQAQSAAAELSRTFEQTFICDCKNCGVEIL